jgi:hypothetical protein
MTQEISPSHVLILSASCLFLFSSGQSPLVGIAKDKSREKGLAVIRKAVAEPGAKGNQLAPH